MRRAAVVLWFGPLVAALACAAPRSPEPPLAEFVISAGDSSYWASIGPDEHQLRAVPMVLARLGDRFQELYTIDDDYSYEDAVFVGQSVWRRDLERGDSLRLMTDSEPARLADRWGELHPDSRPLGDDDPEPEAPSISITTTVDFLDAAGPFVGVARSLDVAHGDDDAVRTTQTGILDLRRPGRVRLADLTGVPVARRMVADARRTLQGAADSARLASVAVRRAALALARTRLDDRALALHPSSAGIAVQLLARPDGYDEVAIPQAMATVAHTSDLGFDSTVAPVPAADGTLHWHHGDLTVEARPDSGGAVARVMLSDGRRSWIVGLFPMPVRRLYWLDRVSPAQRRALDRAFGEATLYDERVRTAAVTTVPHSPHVRSPRA